MPPLSWSDQASSHVHSPTILIPAVCLGSTQLSLSARYPGIKKDLEGFLGVPRVIERAKRYPKTPKPALGTLNPPPGRLFAEDSPSGA